MKTSPLLLSVFVENNRTLLEEKEEEEEEALLVDAAADDDTELIVEVVDINIFIIFASFASEEKRLESSSQTLYIKVTF